MFVHRGRKTPAWHGSFEIANQSPKIHHRRGTWIIGPVLGIACLGLGSCSGLSGGLSGAQFPAFHNTTVTEVPAAKIPREKINTPARKRAADGLVALEKNKLRVASNHFNEALKLDIQNSYLHFLNGLTYHLRAINGDGRAFALAEQGYELAHKFDKSNWLALYYHGQLMMDQKQWARAQEKFAEAALINPSDPDVLYKLAAASYYAGDPASADTVMQRAVDLPSDQQDRIKSLHALAIVNAAMDSPAEADRYFAAYRSAGGTGSGSEYVRRRIESWRTFHESAAINKWKPKLTSAAAASKEKRSAQFLQPDQDFNPSNGFQAPTVVPEPAEQAPDAAQEFARTDMVVVDVVLIGTIEDDNELRGVNLLSGLQLQFGNPFSQNPSAFSWSKNKERESFRYPSDISTNVKTIIKAVQIPGITYSLNIVNSNENRSEIIAKPTLTALVGETSEFFSGTDVNAAAVSGAAGDSVTIEKQVGVKLQVTPELLPDDMVKLKVLAERTFLTSPSQDVRFQFRLDTTRTAVNANVAMNYGETLILSGLMERVREDERDGVPIVQEIPGIQYFFSERQNRTFNKSVLMLLTPRRPQYYSGRRSGYGSKGAAWDQSYKPAVEQLFTRYPGHFQVPRNTAAIFQHLQFNQLYQEFQTGDFPYERWDQSRPHRRRLNIARKYLYY